MFARYELMFSFLMRFFYIDTQQWRCIRSAISETLLQSAKSGFSGLKINSCIIMAVSLLTSGILPAQLSFIQKVPRRTHGGFHHGSYTDSKHQFADESSVCGSQAGTQ